MTMIQKIFITLAVVLVCIGGGIAYGVHWQRTRDADVITQTLGENQKLRESEDVAKSARDQFKQAALDLDARGVGKDKTIADLKAKYARITGHPIDPLPGISIVDVPGPGIAEELVVLRELVRAQDGRHDNDEARIRARDAAYEAQGKALKAADDRASLLETQLRSTAKPRPWAAGVAYNGQIGASVERTWGPVVLGLDIIQRRSPGGGSTPEAVVRVLWRF